MTASQTGQSAILRTLVWWLGEFVICCWVREGTTFAIAFAIAACSRGGRVSCRGQMLARVGLGGLV